MGYLAGNALSQSSVRDEPLICMALCRTDEKGREVVTEERGDLMIRGLEARGKESIVDVKVVNLSSKSYADKEVTGVMEQAEEVKNKKYKASCEAQRRSFIPFICSADGLFGGEADRMMKIIVKTLAKKWYTPYAVICGFVGSRMGIAMIRATHRCLRGSRIPARVMSTYRPMWEDGSFLGVS